MGQGWRGNQGLVRGGAGGLWAWPCRCPRCRTPRWASCRGAWVRLGRSLCCIQQGAASGSARWKSHLMDSLSDPPCGSYSMTILTLHWHTLCRLLQLTHLLTLCLA